MAASLLQPGVPRNLSRPLSHLEHVHPHQLVFLGQLSSSWPHHGGCTAQFKKLSCGPQGGAEPRCHSNSRKAPLHQDVLELAGQVRYSTFSLSKCMAIIPSPLVGLLMLPGDCASSQPGDPTGAARTWTEDRVDMDNLRLGR